MQDAQPWLRRINLLMIKFKSDHSRLLWKSDPAFMERLEDESNADFGLRIHKVLHYEMLCDEVMVLQKPLSKFSDFYDLKFMKWLKH